MTSSVNQLGEPSVATRGIDFVAVNPLVRVTIDRMVNSRGQFGDLLSLLNCATYVDGNAFTLMILIVALIQGWTAYGFSRWVFLDSGSE